MSDEGKRGSFADEFFDDQEPVFRSLPNATVEQAAHPSAHQAVLGEQDIYRDLSGAAFTGGAGVVAGMGGQFDLSAEPVYRSLPAFGEGMAGAPGMPFRNMDAYAATTAVVDPTFAHDPRKAAPSDMSFRTAADVQPVDPVPPCIPRPPFRLAATNCASLSDASSTIAAVGKLLTEHDVEATFKPEKCKFKCTAHVQHERVQFKVNLWRTSALNGDVVVEFQRRQGGALHFNSLYNALRDGMVKQKLCAAPAAPSPGTTAARSTLAPLPLRSGANSAQAPPRPTLSRCFAPLPLPEEEDSDEQRGDEQQEADRAIDNLLATANEAGAAEAAREAAKTIAVLSESTTGIAQFEPQAENVIPRIVKLLMVDDDDIQRCAAAALANVCERLPHLQQNVVDARALRPLVGLASHRLQARQQGSSMGAAWDGSMECVRHCTRALANLCGSHADAIDTAGGVELMSNLVRDKLGSSDRVMAQNAAQFMASLGVARVGMSN